MKNMWPIIFLLAVFAFIFIASMSLTASNKPAQEQAAEEEKTHNPNWLYPYVIDEKLNNTRLIAQLIEYKTCPPLRPERFRRKVKMLWGTDIKDYPEDALIQFGANALYKMSVKYQIMMDWDLFGEEFPFMIAVQQDTVFLPFRKYIFYHDEDALKELDKLTVESYTEAVETFDHENIDANVMSIADLLELAYESIVFQTPPLLMEYIDKHKHYYGGGCGLYSLSGYQKDDEYYCRTSDIRLDMLSLYLSKELAKGREITCDDGERDDPSNENIWLGIHIDVERNGYLSQTFMWEIAFHVDEIQPQYPWKSYKKERGLASFLAFLLQLQHKTQNKVVIQFMSGQLNGLTGSSEEQEAVRDSIRNNDYYGYAILREFCENPMRETSTLEKTGASFKGTVKENSALLYLEPFAGSYDIDIIRPDETFKAYEMGHDDYYFVEVIKPVESPVAGPDGYAMILDRTETVYGYLKKSEVREYTDADTLRQTADTAKSKLGKINDPDGYVNIRREMNAQSEILGKIQKKDVFSYWEVLDSNWCVVKTQDGIFGFVYKDRIKEKLNTGGWVILDDD
jgi:hypothetical protein